MHKALDNWYACPGKSGDVSIFHTRIYEDPAQPSIVLLSEPPDNPGTSVTRLTSKLAREIYPMMEHPEHGVVWIENYPLGEGDESEEIWDEVRFVEGPPYFFEPHWYSMDPSQVEALLEEPVTPEREVLH